MASEVKDIPFENAENKSSENAENKSSENAENKSPKSWRQVEVVQRLEYGVDIQQVPDIMGQWPSVSQWACIVHDKDVSNDGSLASPHIHLMIKFFKPVPTENILSKFRGWQVRIVDLNKVHSWADCAAYLCHDNAPEKYQYPHGAILSNFDIEPVIDAALTNKANGNAKLMAILKAIDSGECRGYNIFQFCTIKQYTQYHSAIMHAFDYVATRLTSDPDRRMDVLYFDGPPGTGKTTYAKKFCRDHNLSFCISSSSNDPLQDYNGQDVLILDDFRPGAWKMDDLLKFLDPFTSSSVASRYRNKQTFYLKYVILTSVIPLSQVWAGLKSANKEEPIKQLYRRVSLRFNFSSDMIYLYLPETFEKVDPSPSSVIDNPVKDIPARVLNPDLQAILDIGKQLEVSDFPGVFDEAEGCYLPF